MTQAHKLIDDIEKINLSTESDLEIIRYNLGLLKSSVKFYLGDDTDLFEIGRINPENDASDEVHNQGLSLLPFDTCLFELRDPTYPTANYFTLIHRIAHNTYFLTPWDKSEKLGYYTPIGGVFTLSFSNEIAVKQVHQLDAFTLEMTEERSTKLLSHYLEPVILALRMMACSNIEVVDNTPSKLKQSRVKKGKTPLFTYKTLHITDAPKTKNKNAAGGTHSSPRVHLRRGHIRKLSDTKTVWVQPCVVGDKKLGIINKDYSFRCAND